VFGYVDGKLSSPGYNANTTLNGYKYFGQGLGPVDDLWTYLNATDSTIGWFTAGTSNKRNYVIRFPMPSPGIKYKYAVVATWDGPNPADHPAHAVEALGIDFTDSSDLYYVDEITNGGNLDFDINIFDWSSELTSTVMEDYSIIIESTVLSSPYYLSASEMTPIESSDHSHKYHFTVPADNVTGIDNQEIWVLVEYADYDYSNDFGIPNEVSDDPLAAAFRYGLTVSDVAPYDPQITVLIPNGGDLYGTGTSEPITWSSQDITGNVKIEYSKDNFASDINVISDSEPNDGEFTWDPIPDDPCTTARIRISSVDQPAISDTSDADFSIIYTYIDITYPSGGENFLVGSTETILYNFANIGLINLEYSRDNFISDINTIAFDEHPTGSFEWTPIPDDPGPDVRLRIYDKDQLNICDTTDAFSIYSPEITLLSPNGGEQWGVGQTYDIEWELDGSTSTVFLEYSKDNFVSDINPIASDQPSDGTYPWEVPLDVSNSVKVRVSCTDNPAINDRSDSYFAIVDSGWARSWSEAGDESLGCGICTDWDGNIYVSTTNGSDGTTWIEVLKYNRYGQMVWTRMYTHDDFGSAETIGIAVRGDYLYLGGSYYGSIDFDPVGGQGTHTSQGMEDIFILKINALDSTYIDSFSIGGPGPDYLHGLILDSGSNIYACGGFSATGVDFDPDPVTMWPLSSNGLEDAWVARYDNMLGLSWAAGWGSNTGVEEARDLALDTSNGNILVAGYFCFTTDFDPSSGTDTITSEGSTDCFISSFDAILGTYNEAVGWGGSGEDGALGITIATGGIVSACGSFCNEVDFNWDPDQEDSATSLSSDDGFIVRCDTSLNYIEKVIIDGNGSDIILDVQADTLGNMYFSGYTSSTAIDLDPGPGEHVFSNTSSMSSFVVSLDPALNFRWGHGVLNYAWHTSLATHQSDFTVASGTLINVVTDLAPGPPCSEDPDLHGNETYYTAYIIKYLSNGCWTP